MIKRCTICNSVNDIDVETNLGDYHSHMAFTEDPKYQKAKIPGYICIPCYEGYRDVMDDFEFKDLLAAEQSKEE